MTNRNAAGFSEGHLTFRNEAELVALLKAGDKHAFDFLVNSFRQQVIGICFRLLLNREDAEDIAQEVFVEVFNSIRGFRQKAALSTWIYRIALSRSLDELKKRKRKKRFSSVGGWLGMEHVQSKSSDRDRPDTLYIEEEAMDQLRIAMDRLPKSQRAAIVLSKIEGYTNGDIANVLGTNTTAVESLIYRAKQNLMKIISNERQISGQSSSNTI